MLTSTFCCFSGVSDAAERRLWESGCLSWDDFERSRRCVFSSKKRDAVCREIEQARIALAAGLPDYFLQRLPAAHRPRVLSMLGRGICYLDIETTGLSRTDKITSIVTYDGRTLRPFVRTINLPRYIETLKDTRMLVTYNGARFDLPFLRRQFRMDLRLPHLDMMPVLRAKGCRGGLKVAEGLLVQRRTTDHELRGCDAVPLWNEYKDGGDENRLRALIAYNAEDVLSLERLLIAVYNDSISSFPGPAGKPAPDQPSVDEMAKRFAL